MSDYNTRKTTEYHLVICSLISQDLAYNTGNIVVLTQLFTVYALAHTVLSKTSKAALLSFFWTGTAPTDHAIWSAERDISSAGICVSLWSATSRICTSTSLASRLSNWMGTYNGRLQWLLALSLFVQTGCMKIDQSFTGNMSL